VVSFYGGDIVDSLSLAPKINSPLLMHFGKNDEMISADQVTRIKKALRGRDEVEIYVYEEAGHSFCSRTRPSYNSEAATLAEERTLSFLEYAFLRTEVAA